MAQAFAWDVRHWTDVREFRAHLGRAVPSPLFWMRGAQRNRVSRLVVHHTWRPTLSQWRGAASMSALGRYYKNDVAWYDSKGAKRKGWSAGPHLFIADDGIWQGTPLTAEGVHAGACNQVAIGVEVVGDYDSGDWPDLVRMYVVGALAALSDHLDIPLREIVGHRDCGSPKSCPGKAIDLAVVRVLVGAEQAAWASRGPCL